MNLSSAGAIANQSLGAVSNQISVVSRNISGVNTPGYSAKTALLSTSIDGGSEIEGIRRSTNAALLRNSFQAIAAQSGSMAISDGLNLIDEFLTLSSGSASELSNSRSPAAAISGLASALQQYSAAPTNATAAQTALARAKDLASSLRDATDVTRQVRRNSDSTIATSVDDMNRMLVEFEKVNNDIVAGTQIGSDITDSLDQRDVLLSKLSKEIGISTLVRSNNDMVVYADGGATLFETTPRSVTFKSTGAFSAGTTGNAVYIDGVQVTGTSSSSLGIHTGRLAGLTHLRDVIAPNFQRQLDETARAIISAFAETDQSNSSRPPLPGLFTFPGATALPGSSLVPGLAGEIMVNPNADPTQGGDINRLRDGGVSRPGDPAYVYNATGAAGYSARILQLVESLSSQRTFDVAAGLGAAASVASYATASIGWIEAQRQQAIKTTNYQDARLSQTQQALSNATGVNLDDQMSRMLTLEHSYQASAKLLATVNEMYLTLFNAIRI